MTRSVDLRIDVTESAGLGERVETAVTVTLPDASMMASRPVVCFAWPGGGYSRQYFTFDMPGHNPGGQAAWHAARGWVFVSCDHLCVGESTQPNNASGVTMEVIAATNRATVDAVLARLANGTIEPDFPEIRDPLTIGIGQSMGGCFLIVQQGQLGTFDGIGVLGYSARHTVLWMPPGTPDAGVPYVPRGSVRLITKESIREVEPAVLSGDGDLPAITPGFHYDDESPEIVAADMIDYPTRRGKMPAWGTATMPPCVISITAPGCVAPEAASITAPVFVGFGERDVCPSPLREPEAYQRTTDVTVFVCPRMSHMHNFASTRERLWARLANWAEGVAITAA